VRFAGPDELSLLLSQPGRRPPQPALEAEEARHNPRIGLVELLLKELVG